jgi:hypothetical protein
MAATAEMLASVIADFCPGTSPIRPTATAALYSQERLLLALESIINL